MTAKPAMCLQTPTDPYTILVALDKLWRGEHQQVLDILRRHQDDAYQGPGRGYQIFVTCIAGPACHADNALYPACD